MNVPLSSFTLLFSERTTDPFVVSPVVDRLRFERPTIPCVFAVMGSWGAAPVCAAGASPPVVDGDADDGLPVAIPVDRPPLLPDDMPAGADVCGDCAELSAPALLFEPALNVAGAIIA